MLATVRSWVRALRRGRARPEPVELDLAQQLAVLALARFGALPYSVSPPRSAPPA
ncbi:MAG: hypothetical protein U0531_20115 [Dehalococcoidia bacterium]